MIQQVGFQDVVSISALRNTCLVLPTLRHAVVLWPKYRLAIKEVHEGDVRLTKTAIALYRTKTVLRLWVPYSRDPTQPMDTWFARRSFELVSPYAERDLGV